MYFFYIDDSGNRDPSIQGVRKDGTPFLKEHLYVLTAVAFFEGRWAEFEAELTDYKFKLRLALHQQLGLQTDIGDCEVKSTYLRVPKERQARSPFLHALSAEQRLELVECYYSQLAKHNMHTFAVVIDKRHLPPASDSFFLHKVAYEILLERLDMFLKEHYPAHKGIVAMDDSDRALNRSVATQHALLLHTRGNRRNRDKVESIAPLPSSVNFGGTRHYRHLIEYPFFTESRLSHGVQLADLCAYNVYRAFRNQEFDYPFFVRMLPHFSKSKKTAPDKLDDLKVYPPTSPLVAWAREGYLAYLKTTKPAGRAGFE